MINSSINFDVLEKILIPFFFKKKWFFIHDENFFSNVRLCNPMLSFWLKFPFSQDNLLCCCFHHHHCWMSFKFLPLTIFFYYLFFVETESNRYLSALEKFFFRDFFTSSSLDFPRSLKFGSNDFLRLTQTANGFPLKLDKWIFRLSEWMSVREMMEILLFFENIELFFFFWINFVEKGKFLDVIWVFWENFLKSETIFCFVIPANFF